MTDRAPWYDTPWTKAVPLIVLAGMLVYAPAVNKGFLFDDSHRIQDNANIGNLSQYAPFGANRFLVDVTFHLNYRLAQFRPMLYHATNIAIHILAALTLYGVIRRTLQRPVFQGKFAETAEMYALLIAVLWVIHPLNTQAVTYVVQRYESMMGLFFLFSFYCWIRGAEGNPFWYLAGVVSCLASLLSKEVAIVAPALLLMYDRIFIAKWTEIARTRWYVYVALFLIMAFFLKRTLGVAQSSETATVGVGFELNTTPWQYLLTQTEVLLHYLRLSVYPKGLCLDYIDWPIATSLGQVLPAAIAVNLLFGACVVLLWYRPTFAFLGFWFFFILAPTSSIVPIIDPAFEHRMYLPLIGVIAAVVLGITPAFLRATERLHEGPRKLARYAAVLIPVLFLVPLTISRQNDYRSPEAMWARVLEVRPHSWRAKVGVALLNIQAHPEVPLADSERLLNDALRENPNDSTAVLALGYLYLAKQDYSKAANEFARLSDFTYEGLAYRANIQLGRIYLAGRRPTDAIASFQKAIDRNPERKEIYPWLAVSQFAAGKPVEAWATWREAIRLDPEAVAKLSRAVRDIAFQETILPFHRNVAVAQITFLLDVEPRHSPELHDSLALLRASEGKFAEAIASVDRGIETADGLGQKEWAATLRERRTFYEKKQVHPPQR